MIDFPPPLYDKKEEGGFLYVLCKIESNYDRKMMYDRTHTLVEIEKIMD